MRQSTAAIVLSLPEARIIFIRAARKGRNWVMVNNALSGVKCCELGVCTIHLEHLLWPVCCIKNSCQTYAGKQLGFPPVSQGAIHLCLFVCLCCLWNIILKHVHTQHELFFKPKLNAQKSVFGLFYYKKVQIQYFLSLGTVHLTYLQIRFKEMLTQSKSWSLCLPLHLSVPACIKFKNVKNGSLTAASSAVATTQWRLGLVLLCIKGSLLFVTSTWWCSYDGASVFVSVLRIIALKCMCSWMFESQLAVP